MSKRNVNGFGQQLLNKQVRECYVTPIFRHSEVENVGHLWSEPYIYIYNHNNVTYIPHYTTIANDVRQNGAIYNLQRY